MKAPLVDLHAASARLFESLGPEGSGKLANKPTDQTHFNEQGTPGNGGVGNATTSGR